MRQPPVPGHLPALLIGLSIALTVALIALLRGAPASAASELAWDAEPNDLIEQAVLLRSPQGKDVVRIVGALEGKDQDAYYWSIDGEEAGVRWNIRLEGRAGAITRLDIFDLTEAMKGTGYTNLPNLTLDKRPLMLGTLATRDGSRPALYEDLMLRPGNYVLGVSHGGGEGAYALEISRSGSGRLRLTPDDNSAESPLATRNGRATAVLTQEATFYTFSLSQDEAGNQWAISVHTPLGVATDAVIQDSAGEEVLRIEGDGGVPIRRSGLQLAAGDYRIVTHSKQLAAQRILVSPGSLATEGQEIEPNDTEAQATEITPGQELSGHLGAPDHREWLRLTVSEADAGTLWNINVSSAGTGIEDIEICLMQSARGIRHCRRATGGVVTLHGLGLVPGEFLLHLDPRGGQGEWRLAWESIGAVEPGTELEPNDKPASAVAWPDRPVANGHFHGKREADFWRFTVSSEPQLWRAQLQGEGIHELAVQDSAGEDLQRIRAGGDAKRIRLDSLFLMPGEYFLAASGTDSDYRLLLRPLGPPNPDAELEPNDEYQNALPLAFGQRRHGLLPESRDQDLYQFSLAGSEHVRLRVEAPADGAIQGALMVGDSIQTISEIRPGPEPGRKLAWDLYLPAGDYSVQLSPRVPSVAEYHIGLERLPLFDGVVDREFNNDLDHASPVAPDGRIEGEVGQTHSKQDWFRLPAVATPTDIGIAAISGVRFFLYAGRNTRDNLLTHDRENDRYTASLEPGTDYVLKLTGKGSYAFSLFDMPAGPAMRAQNEMASTTSPSTIPASASPPATTPPLAVRIVFDDTPAVQSFSPWKQTVEGRLQLKNASGTVQRANMETVLSDDRWRLEMDAGPWTLDAGSSVERKFTLVVPPDALSGRSVRVNVRVTDEAGREAYTMAEIATAPDILPRNPRHAWSVPSELRGGLNVAATALGGRIVASPGIEEDKLSDLEPLLNGLSEYGRWTEAQLSTARRERQEYPKPTIELAGDEPVPVAGFLLNPTSTMHPRRYLREFAVALSQDGKQFDTVVEGTLTSTQMEQAFPLAEPVLARYARLIPLSSVYGSATRNGAIKLGEFKVVARPGFVPGHLNSINLAAPEVGGHLVWADPWIRDSGADTSLLSKDEKSRRLKSGRERLATVVLGFHHSRAARVTSVGVDKLSGVKPETDVARVSISRSVATPLGPFEPVGEWALDGAGTAIEFAQPVWARYLQFRFHGKENSTSKISLPDRIAVWEASITNDYRSILAEWGHYSSNGPLEAAHEPQYAGPAERPDNDSRESAMDLAAGVSAPGLALLDEYESWYRLDVPAGMNTVDLAMRGNPTLQARPELLDAAGESVPLYEDEGSPREMRWQAVVEPDRTYWLRAFEPPRALIISWDTSGSVGWYLPSMANALYRYAEHIRPERDVVNLLPFGHGTPLLQSWQGEPYPLKRILGSYAHDTSSSEAERALAVASRALAERPPGKRAVILLTDAATTTDATLWPALRETRPTVFALGVSSEGALAGGPHVEQDLMQEWARVNGGVYEYITSLGALQQGYERAISRMRQPVAFEVAVSFAFTEDPGPARLRLVSGDAGLDPGARGAVELILDASGSMLQRMDGERRIEIAKAAIADVVENVLPAGMPLALRVYGHREAGSCRTDLEQPLAPLDKAALLARLKAINAVNLAKTPIADSLAKVAQDLSEASGRRWVILLTDGEETCDGDPAAVLEQLAADGIDVRLNIIGFAIDDETLKQEFARWAELGDGAYFNATEAEALQEAMAQALQIPYYVKDSDGETVAEGVLDGESIELPAGRYLVELDTQPPRRFRDVQLAPGDALELDIGAGETQ